jgi:hypothetical protein
VGSRCQSLGRGTNQLTTLTLVYLEADASEILDHHRNLEQCLRQAGNSEEQIKFWMRFCTELDAVEDGDLRSVVATGVALSMLEGSLVVS